MSNESLIVGFLALVLGAAWAFFGLRVFLVLLPIWGFFIGLLLGASGAQEMFGEPFLGSVASWLVAIGVGVAFALVSYLWYYAAVVVLGGTFGYSVGASILAAVGAPSGLAVVGGLLVGVVVGVLVIALAVPVYLVIFLSATSGAVGVVNGALILLGRVPAADLDVGLLQGLLRDGPVAVIAWLVIAALGMLYQLRGVPNLTAPYAVDRERYRVA